MHLDTLRKFHPNKILDKTAPSALEKDTYVMSRTPLIICIIIESILYILSWRRINNTQLSVIWIILETLLQVLF